MRIRHKKQVTFGMIMSPKIKSGTKTTKKSKSVKVKKASKPVADYITVNGHVYERVSSTSKEVQFDLAEDVLSQIDGSVDSGQFVSRGDAIRHILRKILESKEGIE